MFERIDTLVAKQGFTFKGWNNWYSRIQPKPVVRRLASPLLLALAISSAPSTAQAVQCPSFNSATRGVDARIKTINSHFATIEGDIHTLEQLVSNVRKASNTSKNTEGENSFFGSNAGIGEPVSLIVSVSNVLVSSAKQFATDYVINETVDALCDAKNISRFPNTCVYSGTNGATVRATLTLKTLSIGLRKDMYMLPACLAAIPKDTSPELDPTNGGDSRWDYFALTAMAARAYAIQNSKDKEPNQQSMPDHALAMSDKELVMLVGKMALDGYAKNHASELHDLALKAEEADKAIKGFKGDKDLSEQEVRQRLSEAQKAVLERAERTLNHINYLRGELNSEPVSPQWVANTVIRALQSEEPERVKELAEAIEALLSAAQGEYDAAALASLNALGCGGTLTGGLTQMCGAVSLTAQIAAAKDEKSMDAVMERVLAPTAPYARQASKNMWTIAAMVGVAAGSEKVETPTGRQTVLSYGLFVPIGIQKSFATRLTCGDKSFFCPNHVGIFATAFDLGAVATASQSKTDANSGTSVKTEANVKFSSILSPGMFVTAGWNSPVTIGVGATYGPGLRVISTSNGQASSANTLRVLGFVSIEMSILGI